MIEDIQYNEVGLGEKMHNECPGTLQAYGYSTESSDQGHRLVDCNCYIENEE
jgi:hypothetical protein